MIRRLLYLYLYSEDIVLYLHSCCLCLPVVLASLLSILQPLLCVISNFVVNPILLPGVKAL